MDHNTIPRRPATYAFSRSGIHHVLLDIEGTTCPVEFVSDVLFPFAANQLEEFVAEHASDPNVARLLQQVEEAWEQDPDPDAQTIRIQTQLTQATSSTPEMSGNHHPIVAYMRWLIQEDKKLTPLKELQGLIWEDGYQNGTLQGPLFADVAPALTRWHDAGLTLSVYSSGSVKAQQLIYQYSNAGDLRSLFKEWFDTRIGSKLESESYVRIYERLACLPSQILFISDSLEELKAANKAGLAVLHSDRSNKSLGQETNQHLFTSVQEFTTLTP